MQILIEFVRQSTFCRKKSTHIYVTVKIISVRQKMKQYWPSKYYCLQAK